jgi:hypothetical protein
LCFLSSFSLSRAGNFSVYAYFTAFCLIHPDDRTGTGLPGIFPPKYAVH